MDIMRETRREVYQKALSHLRGKIDSRYSNESGLCILLCLHGCMISSDTEWLIEFQYFKPPSKCDDFPFWWEREDIFVREICLLFCIEMTKDEPETLTDQEYIRSVEE